MAKLIATFGLMMLSKYHLSKKLKLIVEKKKHLNAHDKLEIICLFLFSLCKLLLKIDFAEESKIYKRNFSEKTEQSISAIYLCKMPI